MGTTQIAVIATVLFMAFAALASITSNRGYGFDLRTKKKPRRKLTRPGGRRADDAIIT